MTAAASDPWVGEFGRRLSAKRSNPVPPFLARLRRQAAARRWERIFMAWKMAALLLLRKLEAPKANEERILHGLRPRAGREAVAAEEAHLQGESRRFYDSFPVSPASQFDTSPINQSK